jgi:hypothetical protein
LLADYLQLFLLGWQFLFSLMMESVPGAIEYVLCGQGDELPDFD